MIGHSDRETSIITSDGFRDATTRELRVLFVMTVVSSKTGSFWMATEKLAELTGFSPSNVRKARAGLIKKGLIAKQWNPAQGTFYAVAPQATDGQFEDFNAKIRHPGRATTAHSDGDQRATAAHETRHCGAKDAPQRPTEPRRTKKNPVGDLPKASKVASADPGGQAQSSSLSSAQAEDLRGVEQTFSSVDFGKRAMFIGGVLAGFVSAGGTVEDAKCLLSAATSKKFQGGWLATVLAKESSWRDEVGKRKHELTLVGHRKAAQANHDPDFGDGAGDEVFASPVFGEVGR